MACTPERGEPDADEVTAESTLAVPQATTPPERQTPFCEIMLELDTNLPVDQTVDVTDMVLEAYREALPVAPPEIASDLEAVILGLETGIDAILPSASAGPDASSDEAEDTTSTVAPVGDAAPATTSPGEATFTPTPGSATPPGSTLAPPSSEEIFDEEGYVPDDDPTVRLNEYVDFACRDNINNPGPPATQPSATPVPILDGERVGGELDS